MALGWPSKSSRRPELRSPLERLRQFCVVLISADNSSLYEQVALIPAAAQPLDQTTQQAVGSRMACDPSWCAVERNSRRLLRSRINHRACSSSSSKSKQEGQQAQGRREGQGQQANNDRVDAAPPQPERHRMSHSHVASAPARDGGDGSGYICVLLTDMQLELT